MATVEQTMMKVQRILTGSMKLQVTLTDDVFRVGFSDVSTVIFVRVKDWGKDDEGEPETLVLLSSPILRDITATPALFEWVARNAGSRWFGSINLFDEEESGKVYLVMGHALLGDYLDEKELEHALWSVLQSADGLDDELQAQFGGKRWVDE